MRARGLTGPYTLRELRRAARRQTVCPVEGGAVVVGAPGWMRFYTYGEDGRLRLVTFASSAVVRMCFEAGDLMRGGEF